MDVRDIAIILYTNELDRLFKAQTQTGVSQADRDFVAACSIEDAYRFQKAWTEHEKRLDDQVEYQNRDGTPLVDTFAAGPGNLLNANEFAQLVQKWCDGTDKNGLPCICPKGHPLECNGAKLTIPTGEAKELLDREMLDLAREVMQKPACLDWTWVGATWVFCECCNELADLPTIIRNPKDDRLMCPACQSDYCSSCGTVLRLYEEKFCRHCQNYQDGRPS